MHWKMLAKIQEKQDLIQNKSNLTFENYTEMFKVCKAHYISPVLLWCKATLCPTPKNRKWFFIYRFYIFTNFSKV